MRTRIVAGAMTGTSIDGIDIAVAELRGEGLHLAARLLVHHAAPLGAVGDGLRALAWRQPTTAARIAAVARDFALVHAEAIASAAQGRQLDLACVHGQTVFHEPPLSWQLLNPAPIAAALRCPVVHDLRAADLAAGGQGAPITPLADWILLRDGRERRAVVNLGGFCNVTLLPAGGEPAAVAGRDVCACNQILDAVARTALGADFDRDGAAALGGCAQPAPRDELAALLARQSAGGRSLGTGDELGGWVERFAAWVGGADLARSACAAIATTIATALGPVDRVIVAGGGALNRALLAELRAACAAPVDLADDHGVPIAAREALAMAVLGALCQDRVPITLPQVTGVRTAPVAGCWTYPP